MSSLGMPGSLDWYKMDTTLRFCRHTFKPVYFVPVWVSYPGNKSRIPEKECFHHYST